MDYNCPKRYICLETRCAKHIDTTNYRDGPVSSPCKWYEKHLIRQERLEKINKICTT